MYCAAQLIGRLFQLAHMPRSRLVLVGIANGLDLVERVCAGMNAAKVVPQHSSRGHG